MPNPLFATKSVESLHADAEAGHGFRRALGALDLVLLGVGAIIGTGIFVITGTAAANNAGPAVVLSFVVAGVASAFAGLCYAEMASMIPVAGSAYTYAYATMGELAAWIIGWDLILEYLVGAATVSVGWSGYVVSFVHNVFGVQLPAAFVGAPFEFREATHQFVSTGNVVNLPAVLVSIFVTAVLVVGVKESARFNGGIVFVKVVVVLAFLAFTWPHVRPENWTPFIPPAKGPGEFGISGIMRGATKVFFAYIGFDAVSTAAQETRNPKRDLPIGILGSLVVCTVLYIAVSLVLTGAVHYTELGVAHPLAKAAAILHMRWLETFIEIGAIAGLTSVMLVMLMGQPRVFFSMARDGLFPAFAARIHPRFGTPAVTTIGAGVFCAIAGGLLPIGFLGQMTSVGTLFAFVLVCLGVMILRLKRPDLPRLFRVPGGPFVIPVLGALIAGYLIFQEGPTTLQRLFGWMAIGLAIYAFYGRRHSHLRARTGESDSPANDR